MFITITYLHTLTGRSNLPFKGCVIPASASRLLPPTRHEIHATVDKIYPRGRAGRPAVAYLMHYGD